jgi:hypothetical protein
MKCYASMEEVYAIAQDALHAPWSLTGLTAPSDLQSNALPRSLTSR